MVFLLVVVTVAWLFVDLEDLNIRQRWCSSPATDTFLHNDCLLFNNLKNSSCTVMPDLCTGLCESSFNYEGCLHLLLLNRNLVSWHKQAELTWW